MGRRTAAHTIVVYPTEPDSQLVLWRIVQSPDRDDDAFLDSLRSHYELTRPSRGPEIEWAVIWMGLSTWADPTNAAGTATRFPKLGKWLAQIEIRPG